MTKIKICGIKTLEDAIAAVNTGVDYLGFNFYPKSVRYIELESCAKITTLLKREHSHIQLVGVFVNSSVDEIRDVMDTCSLDLAQLHGDETPEVFSQLSPRVFKAFRGVPSDVDGYKRDNAPALLVDAAVKGVYGGSGVTGDWAGAAELAKRYPLFLAGGLTPENVDEAVKIVRPWGVDVASGVEVPPNSGGKTDPGKKDAEKMSAFVKAVREIDPGK